MGQPPFNPRGFLQQEHLPFLNLVPHLVGRAHLRVLSLSYPGQNPKHKPYRLVLKLPDHHFEDRHNAPADSRKCTCELVGQYQFQYDTPDIPRVSPIGIAIVQVVVAPPRSSRVHVVEPYEIHGA